MKTHRAISTTAGLLAVAVSLTLPAGASASSLLSGYGGPGQGNQAILGSALINGPSSGGGGGGASGSAGGGAGALLTPAATSAPRSSSPAHGARPHPGTAAAKAAPAKASAGSVGAYTPPTARVSSRVPAAETPALGLSGGDLLYIVLAVAVLGLTGLATRQVARRPG